MPKEAEDEIRRLFSLAEEEFDKHPERAHRYAYIARKICMKTRTRFPLDIRKKFCRTCFHFLKKGKNCKIDKSGKLLKITCLNCKRSMKYAKT